jgi:hypothetical protein
MFYFVVHRRSNGTTGGIIRCKFLHASGNRLLSMLPLLQPHALPYAIAARCCMPLHAAARRCTPLHAAARRCTPLHAAARCCTPQHTIANATTAAYVPTTATAIVSAVTIC